MKDAPKPEKKKGYYLPTILLGIIVAVIFLLAIFTFQVPATERALVLTMGKITREAEPGLHLRLPLPFQQVIRYDIRKRSFDGNIGHLEETTTLDQKQVVVGINVIYCIKDLPRFKEAAPRLETALGFLGGRMRTAKSEVIGKYRYDELINTDPEQMKIEQMRKEILEKIAPEVMDKYGLEVSDVLFSYIGVPEKTATAIANRMKTERDTEAARERERGKMEAEKIRTEANKEKSNRITDATKEATDIMGKGDAEAASHYAVFAQAPKLAIFLRKLQAMKKIMSSRSTLILSTDSAPFDILNGGSFASETSSPEQAKSTSAQE